MIIQARTELILADPFGCRNPLTAISALHPLPNLTLHLRVGASCMSPVGGAGSGLVQCRGDRRSGQCDTRTQLDVSELRLSSVEPAGVTQRAWLSLPFRSQCLHSLDCPNLPSLRL